MSTAISPIRTARLMLVPLSAEAHEAWSAGDRERFLELTGARLPRGRRFVPPLMDVALPVMAQRLRLHPEEFGRWSWLIVLADTSEAIGSVGLAGAPDARGSTLLGYSLFPAFHGQGFAREAAGALVTWALGAGGYAAVKATVPVKHRASIRVAEAIGMREIGREQDPEAGEVRVFWTERP